MYSSFKGKSSPPIRNSLAALDLAYSELRDPGRISPRCVGIVALPEPSSSHTSPSPTQTITAAPPRWSISSSVRETAGWTSHTPAAVYGSGRGPYFHGTSLVGSRRRGGHPSQALGLTAAGTSKERARRWDTGKRSLEVGGHRHLEGERPRRAIPRRPVGRTDRGV